MVHTGCTCGCGIPNPTPEQVADVRAYLATEYNIHDVETIHELQRIHNQIAEAHNVLIDLATRGIDTDYITRDYTGEAIDELDAMISVDPQDAEGYAAGARRA